MEGCGEIAQKVRRVVNVHISHTKSVYEYIGRRLIVEIHIDFVRNCLIHQGSVLCLNGQLSLNCHEFNKHVVYGINNTYVWHLSTRIVIRKLTEAEKLKNSKSNIVDQGLGRVLWLNYKVW